MIKILRKKNKGSLTVEATLILPLVIISLLFIANILNICMVHLLMQQALNNTAKVISQDSYIIYRFAKEDNYQSFINNISEINNEYERFDDEMKITKTSFDELQTSAATSVNSFFELGEPFKSKSDEENIFNKIAGIPDRISEFGNKLIKLKENVTNTIDKFSSFTEELKKLASVGNETGASVVKKLISDTLVGATGTSISYMLFNNYKERLGVPASKISEINILNSALNSDGSFTIAVDYLYDNPFSFINSESLEYSVINRNIRMTNVITIKPFIGKNGTSLIKGTSTSESSSSDGGDDSSSSGEE